jgi:hypothetical protein
VEGRPGRYSSGPFSQALDEDVGVPTFEVPEPRVPGVPPVFPIGADHQCMDVEGKLLVVIRLRQVMLLDDCKRLPVVWAASAERLESRYQPAGRLLPQSTPS